MGKRVTQRKRTLKENKRERKRMCFPKTPHKKDNQQTLKIHLVTQEKTKTNTKTNKQTNKLSFREGTKNFYYLREEGEKLNFLSDRKTFFHLT